MRGTRNLRKRGNGIYVLSFERLVGTPSWGCTSFWVTSFLGREFVNDVQPITFDLSFSNLSFIQSFINEF